MKGIWRRLVGGLCAARGWWTARKAGGREEAGEQRSTWNERTLKIPPGAVMTVLDGDTEHQFVIKEGTLTFTAEPELLAESREPYQ